MVVGRSLSGGVIQSSTQREPKVGSPPAHIANPPSPLVVAETITTRTQVITTTTSETTTRFFSLPRWRKRSALSSLDVSNPGSDSLQDERPVYLPVVEKALPPTPRTSGPSQVKSADYGEASARGKSTVHYPDAELSSRVSTSALAHAALGLGLPLATPHASSKINTIPFALNPSDVPSNTTSSSIRRARSYIRDEPERALSYSSPTTPLRRARGLSFGTIGFLNLGGGETVKENEVLNSDNTRPVALSRKTSFWNRRKSFHSVEYQPSFDPQEAQEHEIHPLPLLPVLQPSSPLELNTILRSSPAKLQSPGILRSRSTKELKASADSFLPGPPKKRPQTADITARPQVTRSFYSDSPRLPPIPPEAAKSQSPLRPRIHANPPLLHRLSLVFSPSEPLSATSTEKSPDSGRLSSVRRTTIPKPREDEESPSIYLSRLLSTISKAEIAGILASSPDPFYVKALQMYINQFDFVNDPLDVALRKLLMEVGLPRETQQIDRVIEAFAVRYRQCNVDLFISEDHPYILAFSLIMLHTDAFNKSNKHKMSKADYIKNTRLPGVPSEVLDCFYDNIVFAPFIFIEDPLDVNGQRGLTTDTTTNRASLAIHTNIVGSIPTPRGSRIDLYYLISNDLLEPLRINVDNYIPIKNPYSFEGTVGAWSADELQRAFAKANVIEVGTSDATRATSIFQSSSNDSVGSASYCDSLGAPLDVTRPSNEVWTLRVTKVGFLNRKDDIVKGGKKSSNRKWRSWSVILTGSQLLFFRDPSWVTTLLSQSDISNGQVIFPESTVLKPDELLSVRDAIAVFDKSYSKYDNTFRFVMPDGRQILLQAPDEQELNAWIARINYASAFKSAGIRMRPLGLSGRDIELTGVAAATSHLHDLQHKSSGIHGWDSDAPHDLMGMLSGNPAGLGRPSVKRRLTMNLKNHVDFDLPYAPDLEGADQFRATFDTIKAKLDSGNLETSDDELTQVESRSSPTSPKSVLTDSSRLPTRSQIIRSKVHDLQSRIDAATTQVNSDLRIARNIATLTPFRKATRDRLVASVQILAKRITLMRLDITKLTCQRDVLADDLYSEGYALNHVKKVAFKAAKETLQSQPFDPIPRITSPPHREPNSSKSSPDSLFPTSTRLQREESICGSFHSAVEFGADWPSSDDLLSSNFENISPISGSRSSRSSARHLPVETTPLDLSSDIIPSRSNISSSGSSEDTFQEEAEAWNETRCAQRVSLVRVPSDIRMLAKYQH